MLDNKEDFEYVAKMMQQWPARSFIDFNGGISSNNKEITDAISNNKEYRWDMPLLKQMFVSAIIIAMIEFEAGVILNGGYKLNIWDYSDMPFNIWGQVCLPYAILWFFLSLPAIVLDDYLRYWIFGEKKPHYTLLKKETKD